jgi:polyhydroxyalkanoate synthesis regulator phasin
MWPLFFVHKSVLIAGSRKYLGGLQPTEGGRQMSEKKDKVADKAGEIAKNIWLAGVGAYGKAVDDAQDRLEKAGVETPKLFRELVKAGTMLEEEAKDAIQASQAARHSVEDRINRVRENFNLQRPARGEDLLALHEKIDRLSNQLDTLSTALSDQGILKPAKPKSRKKSTAKKASPRKKPVAAKPKAAPKKAPAKKTAAKARVRRS